MRQLMRDELSAMAPSERPWKPPMHVTTPGRPVALRAILTAFSIASVPLLA